MNAKTSFFNRKIFSENVRRILPFALIVLVIEILLLINNLRNIFTTDFFTQETTAKTVNILSMIKSGDIYVSHTNTALRDINQFVMAFYTFCCGVACFYYMFQHKISRTITCTSTYKKLSVYIFCYFRIYTFNCTVCSFRTYSLCIFTD